MAVRNRRSLSSDHRRHDRLLVARHAVGDSQFGQQDEAQELIAACPECAALAADVRHISLAVGRLPAAARARDFRISPEQAERLRGSRVERWLRALGGSGWATLRPLAGVALSVGLVLTVAGVLPVGLPAGGAPADVMSSGQAEERQATFEADNGGVPVAPPEEGVSNFGPEGQPLPAAGDDPISNVYIEPSPAAQPVPDQATQRSAATVESSIGVRELLVYGGLSLAALGLGVLVLVWLARSRFTDPLLR